MDEKNNSEKISPSLEPKPKITLQDSVASLVREELKEPAVKKERPTIVNVGPLRSLRTFQGDMQETLAQNNGSITSVIVAEEKRRVENPQKSPLSISPETKNKFFGFVGILLITLGILAIGSGLYFKWTSQPISGNKENAILPFIEEKSLSIASSTRKDLITSLHKEKDEFNKPVNSVLYLNTVNHLNKPINIEHVTSLLTPKMPDELKRALDDKYMLGVYTFDSREFFIILSQNDYGIGYSGMLKWEPSIISDLGPLFKIEQTASSSPLVFEDEAVKNKDLRVVKDENRKTILLYTFIDRNTILITRNESIFGVILTKFLTNQLNK